MNLPEVHIWRDSHGMVHEVEVRDGARSMFLRHARGATIVHHAGEVPVVEVALFAKAIYHDEERTA